MRVARPPMIVAATVRVMWEGWEGHKAGRDIGYCQMEKLANLHLLPTAGFLVSCFPYKIKGASAGFTRAVALFKDA